MSKMGIISFAGKSGHRYAFELYPLNVRLKANHGGVYVITARSDDEQNQHKHQHHTVHIGETSDLASALNEIVLQRFAGDGANCICIHPTEDRATRSRIVKDIKERQAVAKAQPAASPPATGGIH